MVGGDAMAVCKFCDSSARESFDVSRKKHVGSQETAVMRLGR